MRSRILSACFICLFFAACDRQEKTSVINKTTEVVSKTTEVISKTIEVKTAPEKAIQQITRPPLNLSIDDISIDHQGNDDDELNTRTTASMSSASSRAARSCTQVPAAPLVTAPQAVGVPDRRLTVARFSSHSPPGPVATT